MTSRWNEPISRRRLLSSAVAGAALVTPMRWLGSPTATLGASAASPLPLFRAKAAVEDRLRASGLAWTVLQPNAFMDVFLRAGSYSLPS